MAEFIGARISLISSSDIRYVGTLHEINSETSTVALENVSMLGTEGRRHGNEVAALDSIYEYILFRGTDVKDLRIEEAPAAKENDLPQVPNDPAILGSGTRPTTQSRHPTQLHTVSSQRQTNQSNFPSEASSNMIPSSAVYGQDSRFPQFYHPAGWDRSTSSVPGSYPAIPYAGPPGWYPGVQGFPLAPQFAPYGFSTAPPDLIAQQHNIPSCKPVPIGTGSGVNKQPVPIQQPKKPADLKGLSKATEMPAAPIRKASSPVASKPSSSEVKATDSYHSSTQEKTHNKVPNVDGNKSIPSGPKTVSKIKSPVSYENLSKKFELLQTGSKNISTAKPENHSPTQKKTYVDESPAEPVVMSALTPSSLGHITNERVSNHHGTAQRKPSGPSFSAERSARSTQRVSGSKGGARRTSFKIDVPKEDFDFETANSKFSKHEFIKEKNSVSPVVEGSRQSPSLLSEMPATYNKAMSFFDNISSEVKDRQEAVNSGSVSREWRGEERKKNLETFGQESIDSSTRGGYRGRGRGRGRGGFRGRGYNRNGQSRGRTGYRDRGDAHCKKV